MECRMRAVCAPHGLPRTAPHRPEELPLEVRRERRERREREERERRDEWEKRRVRRVRRVRMVREDKEREQIEESESKKIDREIHHAVCVYHV